MAFTVEDGTGLAAANAYLSIADFQAHHADRGIDVTAMTDPEIQAAVVKSTDYIDKRFGRRFRGYKTTQAQGLEWPRVDAYTDDDYLFDGVPRPLEKATAEYAWIVHQLSRDLAPMPTPGFSILDPADGSVTSEGSGQVIEKTEKVDVIEETTKWATGNSSGKPMVGTGNLSQQIPEYPQADLWIEELIEGYTSRELGRG